jgi:hypothetical protein
MTLGLSLSFLTVLHTAISLLAIASGLFVLSALLQNRLPAAWTGFFLATTAVTSITGFMFPVDRLLPSHIFGIISLGALAVALVALYARGLAGGWRKAFIVTALLTLYLNMFVAIVQSFQKLPLLRPLAPTQSEPPFAVAQIVLLIAFVLAGYLALKRFRPA